MKLIWRWQPPLLLPAHTHEDVLMESSSAKE